MYAREALLTYFQQNELLLCNENKELPYLELVGGSWNGIVSLMESGDVFYSRFYKGRVTYLSRALYYALKPYRRRMERLDAQCLRLLNFIEMVGEANAKQMQSACMMEKTAQTKALNRLVEELFVTVSRRDETIHENWCTFYYCTADFWEQKQPQRPALATPGEAERLLGHTFTQKRITALLKSARG